MTLEIKTNYKTSFYLYGVTAEQFLVLVNETTVALGWEIAQINEHKIIIRANCQQHITEAEIRILLGDGVVHLQSILVPNKLFDKTPNKQLIAVFMDKLELLKKEISHQQLDSKYQELLPLFANSENESIVENNTKGIAGIKQLFIPTNGYFITPIIALLNIIIFILMVSGGANIFLPDSTALLKWGANFKPLTLDGNWWRLITSCFVHIGIVHLLMNMYALVFIGLLLEPILGKTKYIAAYLIAGVAASLTSLTWNDYVISAGASGAIFGMYGIFLALLTTNIINHSDKLKLLSSIGIFVLYNLANGLKSGIDNAAHIGGLLSGVVIGFVLVPSIKQPEDSLPEVKAIGFLIVLLIVSCVFVFKNTPNHIATYDFKRKDFASMERQALEVYTLPQNASKEQVLYKLKDVGIYYWKKNIELLNSLDKLDLTPDLKRRNYLLKEYCELRLESYELMYNAILNQTLDYNSQINVLNSKIEEKLATIQKLSK